ncbi:MAG: hypothetical protein WBE89_18585 [Methyloceanibacter sp.]
MEITEGTLEWPSRPLGRDHADLIEQVPDTLMKDQYRKNPAINPAITSLRIGCIRPSLIHAMMQLLNGAGPGSLRQK